MMRRPMRAGRPSLLGTMATTAVVAGTATAVSGRMNRRQDAKQQQAYEADQYQQQQQMAQMQAQAQQAAFEQQQQMAAMQAQAAPAPAAADPMAQLQQLGQMKAQGLLTDEEFTAAKAKILG
jgi:hypothetical protein